MSLLCSAPEESHAPWRASNACADAALRSAPACRPPSAAHGDEEESSEREENAPGSFRVERCDPRGELREERARLRLLEHRQDRTQRRALEPLDDLRGARERMVVDRLPCIGR